MFIFNTLYSIGLYAQETCIYLFFKLHNKLSDCINHLLDMFALAVIFLLFLANTLHPLPLPRKTHVHWSSADDFDDNEFGLYSNDIGNEIDIATTKTPATTGFIFDMLYQDYLDRPVVVTGMYMYMHVCMYVDVHIYF